MRWTVGWNGGGLDDVKRVGIDEKRFKGWAVLPYGVDGFGSGPGVGGCLGA